MVSIYDIGDVRKEARICKRVFICLPGDLGDVRISKIRILEMTRTSRFIESFNGGQIAITVSNRDGNRVMSIWL